MRYYQLTKCILSKKRESIVKLNNKKNLICVIWGIYSLCKVCNHINGLNEDTDRFLNYLYYSDQKIEKINYAKRYLEDYEIKVKNIYLPKAKFLKKIIKKKNIKLLDLGFGGGHFLKACENLNIQGSGTTRVKS